ncbi:MAG: ATP-binding protein, partial [Caldimicrobium sp.]
NNAYAKFIGLPKDKLINRYFFDICPQKIDMYKSTLKDLFEEAFKGNYREMIGYPLEEDNKIKYYHLTVNPLREEDEIIGAVLLCDDISEVIYLREELKKYTEELEKLVEIRTKELKAEKEKLSIIMEQVNTGITLVDERGNILWMNPKMEDILKMCFSNLEKVDNICEIFGKTFDCLDLYKPTHFIYERVCANQRRVFQVQLTPIIHADTEVKFICLIQDITELKLMEERIMQSEKLQALARISAGLAHEIGNPLTSISSYVQVLKEMDLGEFANQSLEVISKHILRISEIIRNISSFAKPSKGEVIPTDVNEVLESSLNLVKFDKRMKDIKVNLNLNDVPKVLVDPNQLSQVFINIILNAFDAMPDGGDLTIVTRELDNYVEISFTDTGIGIPLENLPHIFDPFFTTKEKGTGFGLAVSYSIVKNFGGEILVESEVGKGSTFIVRLPIPAEGGK